MKKEKLIELEKRFMSDISKNKSFKELESAGYEFRFDPKDNLKHPYIFCQIFKDDKKFAEINVDPEGKTDLNTEAVNLAHFTQMIPLLNFYDQVFKPAFSVLIRP